MTFTHPVNVRTLPRKGRDEKRVTDEDEQREIASEVGVLEVEDMRFEAVVRPWRKGGVVIDGRIDGTVVQECVVTLDPIRERIAEDFEARFVPEGSKLDRPVEAPDGELVLDAEGEDMPETFTGDTIDLARVWLEFLVLSLDPFPRKEGVEWEPTSEEEEASPFAALSELKRKLD